MQSYGTHRAQQEREQRGYVWLQRGLNAAPAAFLGLAVTVQQMPDVGRAFLQAGVQGPNIHPVFPVVITRQEQPFHPGSVFFTTPAQIPATTLSPGERKTITRQEDPLDRRGYVYLTPGIQGPNVKWAGDTIVTRQEQPDFKVPVLISGQVLTGLFKTLARDYAFTTQQLPDHPYPRVSFGNPGNVAAPGTNSVIRAQEQPFHPRSFLWTGLYGVGARVPVTDTVILRQQQPFHPTGFTEGQIRANVAAPVRRTVFQAQEIRFAYNHPRPFLLSFQQPSQIPQQAVTRSAITRQELPRPAFVMVHGVDIPDNAIPPAPTQFPPLQENLTFDMLGAAVQPNWYADPGLERQVLTEINYPQGLYAPVGWTPIGGFAYPIGNLYNRDIVADARPIYSWFKNPDQIGGWKTAQENRTNDLLSLSNQTGFLTEPLTYQINLPIQQLYPAGLTPIGINTTLRGRFHG